MYQYKHRKLLFFIFILMIVGCARQGTAVDEASEIQVKLSVDPSPPVMGEARLELMLADEDGNPIEGGKIELRGDMTHAGMVPVLGEFEESGEGIYQAELEWTMGGDWILTITGTLPDGRKLVRNFTLTVSSEMK